MLDKGRGLKRNNYLSVILLLVAVGIGIGQVAGQTESPLQFVLPKPIQQLDGDRFRVDALAVEYAEGIPDDVSVDRLLGITVSLLPTEQGYVAPRQEFGWAITRFKLNQIQRMPVRWFHESALLIIETSIVNGLRAGGVEDFRIERRFRDTQINERPARLMTIHVSPVATPAADKDGSRNRVDLLEVKYKSRSPKDGPGTDEIMSMRVKLLPTERGYVAPRDEFGWALVQFRLDQVQHLPVRYFYDSAIESIENVIVEALTGRGLKDVRVTHDADDILVNDRITRRVTLTIQLTLPDPTPPAVAVVEPQPVVVEPQPVAPAKEPAVAIQMVPDATRPLPVEPTPTDVPQAPASEVAVVPESTVTEVPLETPKVSLPELPKIDDILSVFKPEVKPGEAEPKAAEPEVAQVDRPELISPLEQLAGPRTAEPATGPTAPVERPGVDVPEPIVPDFEIPAVDPGDTGYLTDLTPTPDDARDGNVYNIGRFVLQFANDHKDLPDVKDLYNVEVGVVDTNAGYIAPRENRNWVQSRFVIGRVLDLEPLTDAEQEAQTRRMYTSAINEVCRAVVSHLNDLGLVGVYVMPHMDDISPTGSDLREDPAGPLRLIITTGVVSEVRTLASGDRIDSDDRMNNEVHEFIKSRSPLESGDLLNKKDMDAYVKQLNRHPGRRVDVAVSGGEEPGSVVLDYMVAESKPWMAYIRAENTGTERTGEWRQQFGFVHNQLTDRDDILSAVYTTSSFSDVHAINVAYDTPLFDNPKLRARVYGTWHTYDASEVGAGLQQRFNGESWEAGGEVVYNIYEHDAWFFDLFAGVAWRNVAVTNETFASSNVTIEGDSDFLLPRAGVRVQRVRETDSTTAQFMVEANVADAADTSEGDKLNALGRLKADREWVSFVWDMGHSFYLEPLINGTAWRDPGTPMSSTLAHEIQISTRGQISSDRLVPQAQQVAGGFYSVRGYPEAASAGDSVYIASAEYRFHLPRMFGIREPRETPWGPFRFAPQQVYGRPDWDLIFRAFADVGFTQYNSAESFEEDETLAGAGTGVELRIKNNLVLRIDWAWVLKSLENVPDADAGDMRIHMSGTLMY